MKLVEERAYWLAWSQVQGIGPTLMFRLKTHFGSLAVAWEASVDALMDVDGIGLQTAQEIVNRRSPLNPAQMLEQHSQQNPHFWTPADDAYPQLLLEIPDPPPILYYRGQVNLEENQGRVPAIAIVGTRSPSDYGKRWTRRISTALAQAGVTVVSGLADGVDAEAHKSCLNAGGRTVAVIGTGVNIVYPWTNRAIAKEIVQTGLILSEYPMGTKPDRTHFPRRNRIIAAFCRAVLVIEAPERSGALITAHLANDYHRDVYALPGSLDNENSMGCLRLINTGAHMILSEAHLLETIGAIPQLAEETASGSSLTAQQSTQGQLSLMAQTSSTVRQSAPIQPPPIQPPPNLSPELDCVFQAVTIDPRLLDTIVEETAMPVGDVLAALVQLEMMGLVAQQPGMMYQKC
ncbi:MAG: DNA-processing protein DprA [Leptolyngbyaceae bacterium]|nr:DNA-processing protein DprA [Leptolyngbyaceae bacterium]